MKKGFTLIELLIVVAVIAILVGIAVPRFIGMRDEANVAKAKGELHAIQIAVESYYIHNNNAYPPTSATIITTYLKGATPKILDKVLNDPFAAAGTEYNYVRSANGQYYVIMSPGPDRTATLTGVDDTGGAAGSTGDDIYATNGSF